jgi:hypothetical protein
MIAGIVWVGAGILRLSGDKYGVCGTGDSLEQLWHGHVGKAIRYRRINRL